ncbi:CrcB protein (plasmid) [Scytonema sp. HK-05]|nr:CrcB protein [Scytonema sp. HK-05]
MTLPTTVELAFETEAIAMHPTKIAFLRMVSLMLGVMLNFIFTRFDKVFDLLIAVNPAIRVPIAISLGAIPGALSRYYLTILSAQWFGTGFPYGIFSTNLTTALVMGFFVTLTLEKTHDQCGLTFTDSSRVFRFIHNFLNLLSGYYDSSTNGELWNSAILLDD